MNILLRGAALGASLLLATLTSAAAQDWPSRTVTVVVPVPAGVTSDIVARVVFEQVGRQLGHTILVWGAIAAANALYTKLPYDTLNDFTPVAVFGQTPLVVVTGAGRYKTLGELVAAAKAEPGKLNYATVGAGSAAHFGAEQLAVAAGFTAQHIPFKGSEWLTEVLAGRLDFSVPPMPSAIGLIRDGKLVPLAVSSSTRSPSLPNVPTMVEAGLKADAVYPFYTAAFLPAKTPHTIAEKLHAEIVKALAQPSVQARLTAAGVDPMPMTMAEFGAFFKKDIANNLELVKAAKMPTQ